MAFTSGDVVAQYVRLRQMKAEMEDRHKTELEPIQAAMRACETWLLDKLNAEGGENIKTPAGTAYISDKVNVSLADKNAYLDFAMSPLLRSLGYIVSVARDKGIEFQSPDLKTGVLWDLLDVKANKTGVNDYLANNGVLPPGVNRSVFRTIGVRTSS